MVHAWSMQGLSGNEELNLAGRGGIAEVMNLLQRRCIDFKRSAEKLYEEYMIAIYICEDKECDLAVHTCYMRDIEDLRLRYMFSRRTT